MERKTKKITIELEEEIDIDLYDEIKVELKDDIIIKGKLENVYKNTVFSISPEIYYRYKNSNKIDLRTYFSSLNEILNNIKPYDNICIDLKNYGLNNETFKFVLETLSIDEVFNKVVEINIENNFIDDNGLQELLIFTEKCKKL